jgi:hypothetical protein
MERHVLVLQLAILTVEQHSQLCLILNLGQGGMKIRFFGEAPKSRSVTITMRGERSFDGVVSWRKDDHLGIAFETALSQSEIVDALSGKSARMRGPRLPVDLDVTLSCGAATMPAKLLNISPSGAAVEVGDTKLDHCPVTLKIDGLDSIPSQVRWTGSGRVGLSFNSPLLLMQMQRALQQGCTTPPTSDRSSRGAG